MSRKIRVGVVCGEQILPRFLNLFEPLRDAFDTCIFAHHHERIVSAPGTGIKMRLFEQIVDMPGFMRGLEDELSNFDFIIGVETSRLATFQALRAARRYGISLGVVVNEYLPYFYEGYANIRAIQYDVTGKSDHFWATSEAARKNLLLERAPADKISVIPPIVDTQHFKYSADGRRKFREYVGLGADDLVILLQQDLLPVNKADQVMRAIHLLRRQLGDAATRVKLVCVGQGSAAMDLKYLAYDLGLGKQVYFLHQDPEPFLTDLYSATDLMFQPKNQLVDGRQEIPLRMLEAMAFGIVPVVGAGTVAAEFASELGLAYAEDDFQHLAARFQEVVLDQRLIGQRRPQLVEHVRVRHGIATVGPRFVAELEEVLGALSRRAVSALRPQSIIDSIDHLIKRGAISDAFVQIEEAMLFDGMAPFDRAELYRLRGDGFAATHELDKAVSSYSEGLLLNDKNFRCLRGLAQAHWQAHDNEAALTHYRRALAQQEGDADTMLGIGMVFRRLGLLDEAVVWLEKCAVRHQLSAAIVALSQTCGQLARPQVAIDVLTRVLDSIGDNQTLMMALGHLYLSSGRNDEGRDLLKRALDCA